MSPLRQSNGNPPANDLPGGVDEDKLTRAIQASGYPLQLRIARLLEAPWELEEEWGYVDRFTGHQRNLDLHINQQPGWATKIRTRAAVDLLVECRQTAQTTIFFRRRGRTSKRRFPVIAGLPGSDIRIDDIGYPVQEALALADIDFVGNPPAEASLMSRARFATGGDLILSGEETYNEMVQPLVSGMEYFRRRATPLDTFRYFNAHAVLGVGLIDGPMVLVDANDEIAVDLEMAPWVRMYREEPRPERHPFDRSETYALDFVHADFFSTFLADWVQPFADAFFERVAAHHEELAEMEGTVGDLESWDPTELEAALVPYNPPRTPPPADDDDEDDDD